MKRQRATTSQPAEGEEPPRKGPATIHDVARRAGVSPSTVSRALTGGPRVSEATRRRVRQVAEELSYRPSRSAQSLRLAKTGTIALFAPTMEHPAAHDHLRAVVQEAFALGYAVIVADGQDSAEIQEAELARIQAYRVDGLLLGRGALQVTPRFVEFLRSSIPVEPALDPEEMADRMGRFVFPFVELRESGAGAIVGFRRLLDLGHTNIAMFHLTERPARLVESRYVLLTELLAQAGLPAPQRVPIDLHRLADCSAEVQRLVTQREPPTAIVSANGRMTPYVLEGVQSAGLRIPDDVSFLCFGDSQWHRAYSPPLSVVREDYETIAREALERLVARIEGHERPTLSPRPSEFVMRGSIGPPRLRPGFRAPLEGATP
ncbi:MAG: LacI family DNA-binding transcriptional regulator [Hyphomicrobiales bacterium]